MNRQEIPGTQAVRVLREKRIDFTPHFYNYEDRGGTKLSSVALGVPEHAVIKTIVLETNDKKPLIVLMHGDCEISTKNLARFLSVKTVMPADPNTAAKHTGYLVGGTSPFGTVKKLPVYAEASIFTLNKIYINGGKRGFLVEINPNDIRKALELTEVNIAVQSESSVRQFPITSN